MELSKKTKTLNSARKLLKNPVLERLLRQMVNGKPSKSLLGRMVPSNYLYSIGSMRKFQIGRINYELDIHDYVGHYLFFGFEDKGQKELMKMVKPADVILDVGANIGSTLLQFAEKVGETGRVYGFEPDKVNFRMCQNNIALNSFDNMQVWNIALGNKKSRLKLVVDTESNRGGNRILNETNGKDFTEVEVVTLDNWVDQQLLTGIDLIKIDVEGFELNVLQGATETLKKFSPNLFIELDDEHLKLQGQSANELIKFLNDMGYIAYHSLTKMILNPEQNFANCHYDIIASKDTEK